VRTLTQHKSYCILYSKVTTWRDKINTINLRISEAFVDFELHYPEGTAYLVPLLYSSVKKEQWRKMCTER
jgi:hypothetical protein